MFRSGTLSVGEVDMPARILFVLLGVGSILVVWLAYIFHGGLVYLYRCLVFTPKQFWKKVLWLCAENAEIIFIIAGISFPLLILALGMRLTRLREEMVEYFFLFSRGLKNQYKSSIFRLDENISEFIRSLFRIKIKESHVGSYPVSRPIWVRAAHLQGYMLGSSSIDRIGGWVLLVVATAIFVWPHGNEGDAFSTANYILPLLMPSGFIWILLFETLRGKNQGSLGYDLLKPLRRERMLNEIGLAGLMFSWEFYLVIFLSTCILG